MCGHGGSAGERKGFKEGKSGKPNTLHVQLPLCFSQRPLIESSIIFRKKRLRVVYFQSVVGYNG